MSAKNLAKHFKTMQEKASVSAVTKFLTRENVLKAQRNPATKEKLLNDMLIEARKFYQFIEKPFLEKYVLSKFESVYRYKRAEKTDKEIADAHDISLELICAIDDVSNNKEDTRIKNTIVSVIHDLIDQSSTAITMSLITQKILERLGSAEYFYTYDVNGVLQYSLSCTSTCDKHSMSIRKLIKDANKNLIAKKAYDIDSNSMSADDMADKIFATVSGFGRQFIKDVCELVRTEKKIERYRTDSSICDSFKIIKVAPILTKDDYDICNNPSAHGLTSDEHSDLKMCFDAASLANTCTDIIGYTRTSDDFDVFFTP